MNAEKTSETNEPVLLKKHILRMNQIPRKNIGKE
jgi:hypothetical protein